MVAPIEDLLLLVLAGILARVSAECPKGLFQVGNSQQCYQLFHDFRRNWFDAKALCERNDLILAEPQDPVAVTSYLVKTYDLKYWTWTGTRGDRLPINSPYWRPKRPGNRLTRNHCLVLMTAPYELTHFPQTPYESIFCNSNKQWTLCQSNDGDHHCGVKNTGNRIVGGQDSDLHEWRWQVALRKKDDVQVCGGSLISNQWVITAAHCYDHYKESDLSTSLGEHNKYNGHETPYTKHVGIKRVIIHPNYNSTRTGNDIALLELDPYKSNSAIHPVCLPTKHPDSSFDGKTGTATGWGKKTWRGLTSGILQEVDLPIITNNKCSKDYSGIYNITNNMICTYAVGKDACQGDSGGPLAWKTPSGYYILVGVVSFGKGCAATGNPGVYTRVTEYLPWIKESTGESFSEP